MLFPQKRFRNQMAMVLFALAANGASAALIGGGGQITSLRLEGNIGLIGLADPTLAPCGGRVYVDVNTTHGRAQYATALTFFASKQAPQVRAHDDGFKAFGACPMYDIVAYQ